MSVWNDIADTPPEAENLRVRSELMMAIEKQITERGWTQVQAADALGLTQPRASDLLRGKVSKFSLDSLVGMAFGLGIQLRADVGESAGSFITTYSLTEVAAMVLPKNWKEPIRWLRRHLVSGEISGYKVGHDWRMTLDDVADLVARHRNSAQVAATASAPPVSIIDGLSARSRRSIQRASKAQKDCQSLE
ncbi:helix-turn-helix domain-containing protein [Mycobacteroides abscessus subsp. abscessus]|uniref:XRE family transcriptional regulator n=1 Tax=Mycobacteroides abscessus TaxID=36809 RepID=UPI00092BFBFA|nr:XRE family transcriptional regulator [Mycobacteroides abscessus]PVB44325.1 XRE family transcriptional regulator [Mycobacteroides abscessus]QSN53737.1 XRE family transcriptional regulator [Mycobacteroides abscessus subsp. abscessus]SIH19018.1 helix-turn-helix domain-containing protein [Mycobacteroides abscessus subsp. abscessus]SIH27008.1 helix-turn-helix domain-containing protein [Mycobacteroides abscessus subsp. abscessus]SII59528.1 helix-turn-helix domain-containing protein [Mycobacteroid